MTPEFIALLGSIIALAVALFGTLKWLADRVDKQFDRVDDRFDRIESELSKFQEGLSSVKEGQARLEGMFEGAFERIPRARPENGGEASETTPSIQSST